MLVLSRKKGETIILQDQIEITILGVESDNVKIGITAPKEVEIFRKEVYEWIKKANQESVRSLLDVKELESIMKKKNTNK
ncbi:putative carbon storage regulator protein [Paenibacillus larvae subsp. larvae]|uniref:Translational regulator CsrA n=1 Tax=Paenibacillus larvae subsp. larvae TaxID=147375 RepID=A0A2L1U865_9BACL|nr:carbon storage regulator CsrA [Paenibacillus larvae]AQT85095.1 carbon storage regulator [Paenibacillus larvae subsp. pulvifaciens]AQZ47098.1 carbon storage regulator [Paenibacillus larvae subsp. pulvifaciens]AVF24378.1 putative carbon storage regulator protein [Paenibacillus larvae subsp. larvae]AVF29139.1 putative carbon storage regulator protein [Paenibacillus larvae subsp. larvae]MBH0341346.1 hypothetical protein [Paenibacillus larvae]